MTLGTWSKEQIACELGTPTEGLERQLSESPALSAANRGHLPILEYLFSLLPPSVLLKEPVRRLKSLVAEL